MNLLLHVGMPKCGSSALQTFLSSRNFKKAVEGRFAYAAIDSTGTLRSGNRLVRHAEASSYGYVNSANINRIPELSHWQATRLHANLAWLGSRHEGVILSSEGWGSRAGEFVDKALFQKKRNRVHVVMYIRPQVEWFNSAWWQWGAWVNAPMQRWVRRNRFRANWYEAYLSWRALSWVDRVDIRLAGYDVVNDFLGLLGCEPVESVKANLGMPESVLRIFQRNRELRPGPHDSAIEFAIARQLQLDSQPPPWVLPQPMVGELIELFAEDNRRLMNELPLDQRDLMRHDDRWWRADCFNDRLVFSTDPESVGIADLEALTVAALKAVYRLDREVRRLRNRSSAFGAVDLK